MAIPDAGDRCHRLSARKGGAMHPDLIESMRDQVCTIYRALTGTDMPESEPPTSESETPVEDVTHAFAELEALVRTDPRLAEEVPPFSFTPPLDAILDDNDLVIEVAVPGIERDDVKVENAEGLLVVSGIQRGHRGSAGTYSHAEIPRGPFYRTFRIPFPVDGEPAVDLDHGLLRVRLRSSAAKPQKEQPQ
jgi:HSP20 family protein